MGNFWASWWEVVNSRLDKSTQQTQKCQTRSVRQIQTKVMEDKGDGRAPQIYNLSSPVKDEQLEGGPR